MGGSGECVVGDEADVPSEYLRMFNVGPYRPPSTGAVLHIFV